MIEQLKLSNFRMFDEEVTVCFAPITVLIGRNNAGKSSIIKFLLMLQQSINESSSVLLQPQGERVNMGQFDELKNFSSYGQALKFELTTTGSRSPTYAVNYTGSRVLEGQKIDPSHSKYTLYASIPYNVAHEQGSDTKQLPLQDEARDARQELKCEVKMFVGSEEVIGISKSRHNKGLSLLDFTAAIDTIRRRNDRRIQKEDQDSKQGQAEWKAQQLELEAQMDVIASLREEIRSLQHLQSTRKELERLYEYMSPSKWSVGQDGRQALFHLQGLKEKYPDAYLLVKQYLETIASVGGIEFDEAGSVIRCFAVNKETSAKSNIASFGFGISQCLPVFVQGAIMPKGSQWMVEQPETQLHPTAQLEMGSFFADLWKKRKVRSIIETHSGNLLLRLRCLIAKGELKAEDVSVAYFCLDDESQKPIIRNLKIDKEGTMDRGLPAEFFEADIQEIMQMGLEEE